MRPSVSVFVCLCAMYSIEQKIVGEKFLHMCGWQSRECSRERTNERLLCIYTDVRVNREYRTVFLLISSSCEQKTATRRKAVNNFIHMGSQMRMYLFECACLLHDVRARLLHAHMYLSYIHIDSYVCDHDQQQGDVTGENCLPSNK